MEQPLADLPLFQAAKPPPKLSQVDRLFIRMMQEGAGGLTTVEMFVGLFCANYTGRLSDGRNLHGLGRGHQYHGKKLGALPGGRETAQWIYFYTGFTGDRAALKHEVREALEAWEAWRKALPGVPPWEDIKA